MGNQIVTLTPKGERWQHTGHPWVYRDDLQKADESFSGQVVQVQAPDRRQLGQAFYNAKSKIALRWLSRESAVTVDRTFWKKRVQEAAELRKRVVKDSNAYRLIHSEADGFPGLIADVYDQVMVVQSLSLGMEIFLPTVLELLIEEVKPKAVVARNDSSVRKLEGLPIEKKLLQGKLPEKLEIKEGKIKYLVNVMEGHKTGAYLDQRENRFWAREVSRGRVLDAFAYEGGFSLQAAAGAEEVIAIEDSAGAIERFKKNLALNKIENIQIEKANAFDALRKMEQAGELFDLIILDPPAFAKNRSEVEDAWRGYREINLRALKMLKSQGTLITCSCSHLVDDGIFNAILREASRDSGRTVRLVATRTQGRDHPVLMTHPESKYLKCIVLEAA